jgi:hypothetical protein
MYVVENADALLAIKATHMKQERAASAVEHRPAVSPYRCNISVAVRRRHGNRVARRVWEVV